MTNRTASYSSATPPQFAFFRGEVVPLEDARVSVMTHALHYGTAVFEGIRGNWNAEHETTYIFRLREHYERLHLGCRMLMLDIPYSVDDLCKITVELVEKKRQPLRCLHPTPRLQERGAGRQLEAPRDRQRFHPDRSALWQLSGHREPALLHLVVASSRGPDDADPGQDLCQLPEQHPGQDGVCPWPVSTRPSC